MKNGLLTCLSVIFTGLLPFTVLADFTQGNLIVVNDRSAMSVGVDSLVEYDSSGTRARILVPENLNITGMRRVVYDPVSGHLFYSVSSWPDQVFEIREIDDSGNQIAIYPHPDFDSGNISMAMASNGDLFIANGGYIYVKESGQSNIIRLFTLPYTGIGDLEIDHLGNLFLSDPFISDVVYKISPDGTIITYADPSDGLDGPYGLAVDSSGNLFIANNTWSNPSIVKIDTTGQAELFTTDHVNMGILDMTFDEFGTLFTVNRENDTIFQYDQNGLATLFADGPSGLRVPSSLAFIVQGSTCTPDADTDGDVDGMDLVQLSLGFEANCMELFAASFGSP